MINTLCIDGLPVWVTESQVCQSCERYGQVIYARVVRDAYGVSLGYAFVEMATRQAAEGLLRTLRETGAFGRHVYVARTYPVCHGDYDDTCVNGVTPD